MMSSVLYNFGYELGSKQIRRYVVNDVRSVHRALASNIQDYLAYEGVKEENPVSLKNVFLKVFTLGVAAGAYALSKRQVSGLLLAGSFLFFGMLIVFQIAYNIVQNNGDIIFVGTGRLIEDKLRSQKPCFCHLVNRRLCVRLTQEDLSIPVVTLTVQLIGPSSLFSQPPVYSEAVKTVQYGQFFGSTGFFFPPPLLKLVDELLESAVSTKRK
ncbi:hypothetical protein JKF63_07813 [Porcisia hertigi]|uniref:Uncharacterized protein n=1 Tax=Porcisia hertigi TaxID=2761500 RepID=A0A836LMH4_9TRYP|nr:hypothetical protein JKF63_07813 [Porcisia hertigi]